MKQIYFGRETNDILFETDEVDCWSNTVIEPKTHSVTLLTQKDYPNMQILRKAARLK